MILIRTFHSPCLFQGLRFLCLWPLWLLMFFEEILWLPQAIFQSGGYSHSACFLPECTIPKLAGAGSKWSGLWKRESHSQTGPSAPQPREAVCNSLSREKRGQPSLRWTWGWDPFQREASDGQTGSRQPSNWEMEYLHLFLRIKSLQAGRTLATWDEKLLLKQSSSHFIQETLGILINRPK